MGCGSCWTGGCADATPSSIPAPKPAVRIAFMPVPPSRPKGANTWPLQEEEKVEPLRGRDNNVTPVRLVKLTLPRGRRIAAMPGGDQGLGQLRGPYRFRHPARKSRVQVGVRATAQTEWCQHQKLGLLQHVAFREDASEIRCAGFP